MEENSTAVFLSVRNLDNSSQANLSDNTSATTESTSSSDIGRLIRLATLPVNIIFGTVGNVLILFVMQRGSLKKTPICFYMSALAVADTGKDTLYIERCGKKLLKYTNVNVTTCYMIVSCKR